MSADLIEMWLSKQRGCDMYLFKEKPCWVGQGLKRNARVLQFGLAKKGRWIYDGCCLKWNDGFRGHECLRSVCEGRGSQRNARARQIVAGKGVRL